MKPKFETPDLTATNIDKIAQLFPGVVTEGKVNFDLLRSLLGDEVHGDEAYEFTWVGKREAIAEAGRPIRKTLRPCVEESKNWDTTENLYIEGDNLDVLKLLQESYLGQVKMIYIDPPYNTGNDFIYRDDFKQSRDEYDEAAGAIDEDGDRLYKNTKNNGRFHSDWCSMIYPRLVLARNLLREDGVIFVSIDDNEVAQLRKICDEIFGEKNFIANFIVVRSEGGGLAKQAVIGHDYLLVYSKNQTCFEPLGKPKDIRGKIVFKGKEKYWVETDWLRKEFGKYGTLNYEDILEVKGPKKKAEIDAGIKNGDYTLLEDRQGKHIVGRFRKVADDTSKFYTILKHLNKNGTVDLKKIDLNFFDYPKPISLIKEAILGATIKDSDAIILDFFAGSGTTGHAVMQLNAEDGGKRKFIMVQLPEVTDEKSEAYKAGYKNICEIGKERIRRAGEKILELNPESSPPDIGFRVLKLDDSNMQDVYFTPAETRQEDLLLLEDNLKPDRTDSDLLYGCLLDWGLPLSLPHRVEVVVDSDQLVASGEEKWFEFRKEMASYGYRELQRVSGMAKGDGADGGDLPTDKNVAPRGVVWFNRPDATIGSFDTLQHRGRTVKDGRQGVPTLSLNCKGVEVRAGDSIDNLQSSGLSNGSDNSQSDHPNRRSGEDANFATKIPAPSNLIPPPTTPLPTTPPPTTPPPTTPLPTTPLPTTPLPTTPLPTTPLPTTVHIYNDGDLVACFDVGIGEKAVRAIAQRCGAPERAGLRTRAVFRDASFSSSDQKINVFEIFKLLAPQTDVKVI